MRQVKFVANKEELKMAKKSAAESVPVAGVDVAGVDPAAVETTAPAEVIVSTEILNLAGNDYVLTNDTVGDERANEVRGKLSQLRAAEGINQLVQGAYLYEAFANNYHKRYPYTDATGNVKHYDTFEQFVTDEVGMKARTADDRRKLYQVLVVELNVPAERIKRVSTKLSNVAQLVRFLTKDNYEEYLNLAETCTWTECGEIRAFLTKNLEATPDQVKANLNESRTKRLTSTSTTSASGVESTPAESASDSGGAKSFKVTGPAAQIETIKEAISLAKTLTSSESDTYALEVIAIEYLSSNSASSVSEADKQARLLRILSNVEAQFGVSITVAAPESADSFGDASPV